jgi:predicted exporter
LIGEAVDYSIYLFVQSEKAGEGGADSHWIKRFWPTVRLGVLTSIFGFASLLLSGFPGLAQLGLYSIAGLIAAALVTRFVLPHLLPANFRIHDISAIGGALSHLVQRASVLRWPAIILLLAACAVVLTHRTTLWNDKLSSLSPVSQAEVDLDTALRADMGAPDVRYVVVVKGTNREAVLESAERVAAILQIQVELGELARFDSPTRFLPSAATQRARLASLPEPAVLEARLAQAVQGLPVRAPVFTPFLADVAAARERPLLQPAQLEQTSLAMAVSALLIQQDQQWNALLPLTAPAGRDIDASRLRAALAKTAPSATASQPQALFVDMKAESYQLYAGYLHEAIWLSLGGLVAIIGLLLVVCRSLPRVARIVAPLFAAVVTVTAGLTLLGQQLTILHLVGLLLVVAVGSNYALFFDRTDQAASTAISPRTLASMLLANLTTVAGFGLLAFSSISILRAMGTTVAPGVILALIFAAIFARKSHA